MLDDRINQFREEAEKQRLMVMSQKPVAVSTKAFLESRRRNWLELQKDLIKLASEIATESIILGNQIANMPIDVNEFLPDKKQALTLIAYCDGGASPNPGFGGWGYVIVRDENKVISECHNPERLPGSTNNQMEICAAINALSDIQDYFIDNAVDKVIIRSDSKYLIFTGKGEWKVNPDNETTRNRWRDLFRLIQSLPFRVEWEWIARDSDPFNTMADKLSNRVR